MTFTHLGEQWLDQWMEENAFVCFFQMPASLGCGSERA